MKKNSERLTRGEEEVMQILWSLGQACCNDIIARFPDPKPKYTTVATFIKILENKGFVAHYSLNTFSEILFYELSLYISYL